MCLDFANQVIRMLSQRTKMPGELEGCLELLCKEDGLFDNLEVLALDIGRCLYTRQSSSSTGG